MGDVALLLDLLILIPSLAQSSLLDSWLYVQGGDARYNQFTTLSDANTIGSIASVGKLSLYFGRIRLPS